MTKTKRTRYAVMHGSGRLTEREAEWLIGELEGIGGGCYDSDRRFARRVGMKVSRALSLGRARQSGERDLRSVMCEDGVIRAKEVDQ